MFKHNLGLLSRSVSVSLLTLCSLLPVDATAQVANENAIELEFVPPQLEAVQICVPREPDAETTATWESWDGGRLPNIAPELIKRDMNRLMQIDPSRWNETVQLIITRLEEADPSYSGPNATLARIASMVAAGDYEMLRGQQLVPKLAANSSNLSPRIKNALSGFYRDGIGVERDLEIANQFLIEAGFGGNADALLTLTKMQLDGEPVDGWDLDPRLAVTMAFGSLVGELDASICDRVARIAREYRNGEIVQPNKQLSHDWFRFAADLGDSNSAWKVAEYHMQAEGFEKDNQLLLKYLTQASNAGLSYAQIALGQVYETGSLVEADLNRTLELYRAAAASGLRPGLTRLALFIEGHPEEFGDLEQERLDALYALSELDDVAGWVFTRLAKEVYASKGRWAGQAEAISYLERAAELGDMDGMVELAAALVARRSGSDEFERAVDLLSYSVSTLGGVSPSTDLFGMFMCQANDSPRIDEALHWQATEIATGTANIEIAARELVNLEAEDNALTIAVIQSQALYGRPRALASYLKYLESSPEVAAEIEDFWRDYADQYASVLQALAELELELSAAPRQRLVAINLLRRQYQRSGSAAALALAEAMLDYETQDDEFSTLEVVTLLQQPASRGQGAAMKLLSSLSNSENGAAQIFNEYQDVIEANGDFEALLFAIPFVDEETQATYLSRAAGIIPCDYKNTMAMVETYLELDDRKTALHWLGIAESLLDGNTWAMIDLAEIKLELHGPDAAPDALKLFQTALARGDLGAARGIFDLSMMPETSTFDPARAAEMITLARARNNPDLLARFLGGYRRADDVVRSEIDQMINIPDIMLASAETGDIYSMRAYAMHLRETAGTATELVQSTQWLAKAAEGGDTTAMAEYGYALAFGIGTEADLPNALQWLQQAAANGSAKAATITQLIDLSGDT